MNKKLLSLAVAAAMTAPAAAFADATLYGKLHVSLDYADVKNVIRPVYDVQLDENGDVMRDANGRLVVGRTPGEDFKGWGMSGNGHIPGESRASRLGVKGSEDLGGGLKAIYQLEFGVNLNDTNNNVVSNADSITYRNSFVGLAGNFGTFLMGRHDTPMKISTGKLDMFVDTMADYNGTVGFRDLRADNVIAYISPSWSGFQFAGAVIPVGGATAGFGENLNSDGIADGYSLAGIYSNGPFYGSAAYESLGNELFNDQENSVYGSNCPYDAGPNGVLDLDRQYDGTGGSYGCDYESDDSTAWRFGLGLLDWNGFSLTGIYETRDSEPGSNRFRGYSNPADLDQSLILPNGPDSVDLWQIQAGYAFGNNMIKAMYGQADYSGDIGAGVRRTQINNGPIISESLRASYDYNNSTWGVAFDHNFSKRTKAYALYTDVTSDGEDFVAGSQWSGFSLGMIHKF